MNGNNTAARNAVPGTAYMVGDCGVDLWSLTPRERFRRSFKRVGVKHMLGDESPLPDKGGVIMVHAEFVFDHAIIGPLAERIGIVVTADTNGLSVPVAANVDASLAADAAACIRGGSLDAVPSDIEVVNVEELTSSYDFALRKRETPYLLRIEPDALHPVEWRMFQGSYKGVTDFVTKWFWPVPAFWVTKYTARSGLSPNFVTTVGLVLVVFAYFLFEDGFYTAGLAAAWVMTFLDTVDGKLARLTLTSSKFGNLYDHGIDLIHPPFWYLAWGFGLAAYGTPLETGILSLVLWVLVVGYVVGRAVEGVFVRVFGMHIHVWQKIDSRFRLFTARRNPNMVVLTIAAIAGRPDIGLIAIAIWTVVCIIFHSVRLYAAMGIRKRDGVITSWLT